MMFESLLARERGEPIGSGKIPGVVVGLVTNNVDPERLGRVKVKFPWLSGEDESHWARMATLMAGAGRGSFYLPEVDDEVLLAFEQGDVRFPYVIGMLWNGVDRPPYDNADGENNLRVIRSRSGHELIFDDNGTGLGEKVTLHSNAGHTVVLDDSLGSENITIRDRTGLNSIVIDSVTFSTTVTSQVRTVVKDGLGNNFVEVNAPANTVQVVGLDKTVVRDKLGLNHLIVDSQNGMVTLSCLMRILIKDLTGLTQILLDTATQSISLTSPNTIRLQSKRIELQAGDLELSAAKTLKINGTLVKIN